METLHLYFMGLPVLQIAYKKHCSLPDQLWDIKMVQLSAGPQTSPSRFSGQVSDFSAWYPSVFSGINQLLSFVFPTAENTFETLNDSLEDEA